MIFYFPPSKLSKRGTKGLLPILFSASFQWKSRSTQAESLLQRKAVPKKRQKGTTKAATKSMPYDNVAEYAELTPRHGIENIY